MSVDERTQSAILIRVLRSDEPVIDELDPDGVAHLIRGGLLVRESAAVTATTAATAFFDLAREFPHLLPT
jgi:hypothetical protein